MSSFCIPLVTESYDVHKTSNNNLDSCVHCGFFGGDVRINRCSCLFHTRCICLPEQPLTACPHCKAPTDGMTLIPMSFRELDDARKASHTVVTFAQTSLRKKRKGPGEITIPEEKLSADDDQRVGRWTPAETAFVDEIISKFEAGMLPVADGAKLNDFLAAMLQCKQSRLTKKMKNAKLSARSYKRSTGYIHDLNDAREFSSLEEAFFYSIHRVEERAEMRFHMQKQWRDLFCLYCLSIGQPLDSDEFANSVDEIQRRADLVRDALKLRRREQMMALALQKDQQNTNAGAIIDMSDDTRDFDEFIEYSSLAADDASLYTKRSEKESCSPYLDEIMKYMERTNVPFEHIDAWVPSFVPPSNLEWAAPGNPKCRLCFAGYVTADVQSSKRREMSHEEHFKLETFGKYSQKFSFDIGCGLPGRVYQSGIATWEQSVQNAPVEHFERCGGAIQCGVRTVVGIPVPSPSVGRIVVILYSCHDRPKDQELVARLSEELTKQLPSPRWQLIVDLGHASGAIQKKATTTSTRTLQNGAQIKASEALSMQDHRVEAVVNLLGEHMPSEPQSPLAAYLPGFMSLRLLILRPSRSDHEEELLRTMLDSYESYTSAGRSPADIALLLARDCMFVTQQQPYSHQVVPAVPQHQMPVNGSATANYKSYVNPVEHNPSSNSTTRNQVAWNQNNGSQTIPGYHSGAMPPSHAVSQQYFLPGMQFAESLSQGNRVGETSVEACKNAFSSEQFHSSNSDVPQI